ncbi:hypothetical protein [Sediminibacillus massiliensis]|uniref:hypothetical protein n=1 Tax=Sediminibacillus massiliensis TaxID=1926277 RepID=UPI0015C360D2|nr:hypothetical protein [Sediminibacillus massiliensis]
MSQYRLYNSEDIHKLEQELEFYKDTLQAVDSGHAYEYLKKQRELYNLNVKFSTIKGEMKVMEENYQERISGYERREKNVSSQIQTLEESLSQLKYDVRMIKSEMERLRFSELLDKVNIVINKTDDHLYQVKKEIDSQREEFNELRNELKPNPGGGTPQAPRQSEYRRLQNMLQSTGNIEQYYHQKKTNEVNSQAYRNSMTYNQHSAPPRSFGASNDSTPMRKGKKMFRNSQYDLNKNIITRTTTSKNMKGKKKAENPGIERKLPEGSKEQVSPFPTGNTGKEKKEDKNHAEKNIVNVNPEESSAKLEAKPIASHYFTTSPPKNQEKTPKTSSSQLKIQENEHPTQEESPEQKSKTAKPASLKQEQANQSSAADQPSSKKPESKQKDEKDGKEQETENKKMEFASFFSLFKKI